MEIQPVDLTALIPATLGVLIVLIPVLGFTIRFALRPVLEALAMGRTRDTGTPSRDVEILAQRVRELEEEVIRLKNSDQYRASLPPGLDPVRPGQTRG